MPWIAPCLDILCSALENTGKLHFGGFGGIFFEQIFSLPCASNQMDQYRTPCPGGAKDAVKPDEQETVDGVLILISCCRFLYPIGFL